MILQIVLVLAAVTSGFYTVNKTVTEKEQEIEN